MVIVSSIQQTRNKKIAGAAVEGGPSDSAQPRPKAKTRRSGIKARTRKEKAAVRDELLGSLTPPDSPPMTPQRMAQRASTAATPTAATRGRRDHSSPGMRATNSASRSLGSRRRTPGRGADDDHDDDENSNSEDSDSQYARQIVNNDDDDEEDEAEVDDLAALEYESDGEDDVAAQLVAPMWRLLDDEESILSSEDAGSSIDESVNW